ncbi:DUF3325 domain-containing protein [Herbaspirillum sp. NPDC087042]|uniref:DUF3325 domain-containing protein n=1 Tax=Herbaspirillum sp. NPDC087042 TaxID=3364004 RepID=UPI0037FD22C4
MNPFGVLLALGLAYCAWSALSQAMDRHYADVRGRGAEPAPALRRRLRWLGTLGLLASFAVAVRMQGWSIGLVAGTGLLTVAGVLHVLALSYRPAQVPRLAQRVLACLPLLLALWMMAA